jgi:ferric-dicitrate binding protein FerR (iron transport regulator)
MEEKYVRELGWMRNVDLKDGSRVMMDEKNV